MTAFANTIISRLNTQKSVIIANIAISSLINFRPQKYVQDKQKTAKSLSFIGFFLGGNQSIFRKLWFETVDFLLFVNFEQDSFRGH